MVYDALQGQMGGALHALALETIVPKDDGPALLHRDRQTNPMAEDRT